MVKARCDNYNIDDVERTIKRIFDQIEIYKYINFKGKKVLLKPNLVSPLDPSKAVTTHPVIVEAVIKNLIKLETKEIWIGDSGLHCTPKIFSKCGMTEIIDKYHCKLCDFDNYEISDFVEESNKYMKKLPLTKYVMEADVIINLPKLKTHHAVVYTGAMKNLYGTIVGKNKLKIHAKAGKMSNFDEILVDLLNTVKPHLNIMDGIIGLEGNGPCNGKSIQTGIILGSYNAVALDIVATKQIGIDVKTVKYLEKAIKRGIGVEPNDVIEVGDEIPIIKYDKPQLTLVKLSEILQKIIPAVYYFLKPIPKFSKKRCTKCGICEDICPMHAIEIQNDFPVVMRRSCISCFCCQEACFNDAIERSDIKKGKEKCKV